MSETVSAFLNIFVCHSGFHQLKHENFINYLTLRLCLPGTTTVFAIYDEKCVSKEIVDNAEISRPLQNIEGGIGILIGLKLKSTDRCTLKHKKNRDVATL